MFASLKKLLKRRASEAAALSGYGPDKNTLRYKVSNWLLTAPRAASILALSAVLIASLVALIHIHTAGQTRFDIDDRDPALVFIYMRGFYLLGLGLCFPVLVLSFLRHKITNLIIPVSIASGAVFAIWLASEIILWQPSTNLYHSGIEPAKAPRNFSIPTLRRPHPQPARA